jgi:hypothetical protein
MRFGLAKFQRVVNIRWSARRIGLCWEATRAPWRAREPQAWATSVAQAGLLRARLQSEKSQGVWGTASPKSNSLKPEQPMAKRPLAFQAIRRFMLNQYT